MESVLICALKWHERWFLASFVFSSGRLQHQELVCNTFLSPTGIVPRTKRDIAMEILVFYSDNCVFQQGVSFLCDKVCSKCITQGAYYEGTFCRFPSLPVCAPNWRVMFIAFGQFLLPCSGNENIEKSKDHTFLAVCYRGNSFLCSDAADLVDTTVDTIVN